VIKIAQSSDLVTLINVFSYDPQNQPRLVDSWIRATEERLGALPGIISAALHRSKDSARVVNYAQWKSAENWENPARIDIDNESRFGEMGKFAKPDAHLYEVCYLLAKTDKPGEVGADEKR
jgi:Antibiotic biosynthesis monooxygenase